MEGREERAGLDEKGAASDLLDAAGDAKAVHFAGGERLEDHHVESTLQEIGLFVAHGAAAPIEIL
jgi:hypothetical protein